MNPKKQNLNIYTYLFILLTITQFVLHIIWLEWLNRFNMDGLIINYRINVHQTVDQTGKAQYFSQLTDTK